MSKKNLFIILTAVFLITSLFAFLLLPQQLPRLPEYATSGFRLPKAFVVYSGSMEPAIKTASVVFSIPQKTYQSGDIITFAPDNSENLVTHRVELKNYPDGVNNDPVYITSGDANEDFDRWEVTNEQITGKVFFSVPYLGYAVDFAKQPYGFILFVIIPATIIIYEEVRSLIAKLIKLISKKRGVASSQRKPLPKISAVVPIMGALLVFVGLSVSYLFDSEKSFGNVLSASNNFGETPSPTPTTTPSPPQINPGDIVINEVHYRVDNEHKVTPSESGSEWAELYNNTENPISLSGWSIADNTSCDNIPENPVIAPHSFAIVAVVTEEVFRSVWTLPESTTFIQSPTAIGNGLANNDEIILRNGTCPEGGVIIDHISWGSNKNAFDPSIPTTEEGHSSERGPDGADTDTASDFVEMDIPTPGT